MRLWDYIKDKLLYILTSVLTITLISFILWSFHINKYLIIYIDAIIILGYLIIFILEFIKRKIFYDNLKKTLKRIDQKYLITEVVNKSNFLEGNIFIDTLYEIDKSMHEYINTYKYNKEEFKEYIELWCHEVKTPIATSKLIIENHNDEITKSILEEIEKIDNYIEQVLFYSRSDNVEKDYIITKCGLKDIVDNVIKRNKKDFISKHIKINIEDNLPMVDTDSKWIEFIINQIIANSIKYSKDKQAFIKISSKVNKNNTMLMIEDNGIGIAPDEISRVFDKGFTGTNGRKKYNSTGIGLYLCNKLCLKLGHNIALSSTINEKTIVTIIFPSSSMLTEIK